MKTARFKPGEAVPRNGVYRVEHKLHRLMHKATLEAHGLFPSCKECGNAVDYYFVRWVRSTRVLPLRSGILEEYLRPVVKANRLERGKKSAEKISP